MAQKYMSKYTGPQIDSGIQKAYESDIRLETHAKSGGVTGKNFAAESPIVNELYEGLTITIIPNTNSRATMAEITLDLNETGDKPIVRPGTPDTLMQASILYKGIPAILLYTGSKWIHINGTPPFFDYSGAKYVLSITHGGTGLTTIAQDSFIAGNGTDTPQVVHWSEMADYIECVSKHGGTMDGALTVLAPTADGHAATKKYVDDSLSGAIEAESGVFSGYLESPFFTVGDNNNRYVSLQCLEDSTLQLEGWNKTGGAPAGIVIRGVADPTANNDAASKKYVDELVGDVESLLAAL